MRALTYSRKSTTDSRNPGKSVADQRREAEAEVARRGWTLVRSLTDDGVSASRHAKGRSRPGFEEVLRLIDAGEVNAVVMAEQSRATRSLAVLGALLESCADRGVLLVFGGTDLDPSRPEGLLMAGITGAVDATESERTRQRVLRGSRGGALAGRPHGRDVYGYHRTYHPETRALLSIEPDENAPTVVEIVDKILAGDPVRAIVSDLTDRGVPTPGGGAWHASTVRRIATSPTYAGLRVHQGKVVGRASWPALLTEDRHRAAVARLSDPSRRRFKPGRQRHLMSGTARCGECGGPLRVVPDRRRWTYSCFSRGCYKVSIGYEALEEFVSTAVRTRLSRPDVLDAMAAANGADFSAARDKVEGLTGRKQEISKALANGMEVTVATEALAEIEEMLRSAKAQMSAAAPDPTVLALSQDGSLWDRMTTAQRAAVIRLVVTPTVHRSTQPKGTRGFDPARVDLHWLT